jgi:DNA-binding transcriptional ArsR family regulator
MKIALISETAQLIGDPARANMLMALKDDGEISSGALATVAGVAASTASGHLAKLVAAGLITVRKHGRRRYYSLAGYAVAEALESIEGVANTLSGHGLRPAELDRASLHARCCYDHIAGRVGVGICDAMFSKHHLAHSAVGVDLTDAARAWLASIGIDVDQLEQSPRRLVRLCSDWSMQSLHVGGAVGAAILARFLQQGWMRRRQGGSVLMLTPVGSAELRKTFDLDFSDP